MRTNSKKQGFTLVEIMIAVGIVILLAALSIHGLLRAKITANEAAAIRSLRTLQEAFESYKTMNRGYPSTLASLTAQNPPYIDEALKAGTRQGYNFNIEEVGSNNFRLAATPVQSGYTGIRSFYINQGGEIIDGSGVGLGNSATTGLAGGQEEVSVTEIE